MENTDKILLPNSIEIACPWGYLAVLILFVIVIRVFLCLIKARSIQHGEADVQDKDFPERNITFSNRPYWDLFWLSYFSSGNHRNVDDYGLPAIIGFLGLLAYPVLMKAGLWGAIGVWLGIKTASQWGGWHLVRTPYNRFLLANLLPLFVSFLFLTPWITIRWE